MYSIFFLIHNLLKIRELSFFMRRGACCLGQGAKQNFWVRLGEGPAFFSGSKRGPVFFTRSNGAQNCFVPLAQFFPLPPIQFTRKGQCQNCLPLARGWYF